MPKISRNTRLEPFLFFSTTYFCGLGSSSLETASTAQFFFRWLSRPREADRINGSEFITPFASRGNQGSSWSTIYYGCAQLSSFQAIFCDQTRKHQQSAMVRRRFVCQVDLLYQDHDFRNIETSVVAIQTVVFAAGVFTSAC